MKKKNLVVLSFALIALIVITVAVTYAFFNYAQAGTTDNTLETGNITFLYTETSNVGRGIAITDAFPVSNEEGKLLTGEGNVFDFNISSTTASNTNIPFEITARKSDDSTLSEEVVVMYLTKVNGTNEEEVLLDKYNNLTQTEKTDSYIEKVLYNGTVYSNDNYDQDYRLRMWITNDGSFTTDDMGKTFAVTVNVYADASVVTESQVALENNANVNRVLVNDTEIVKTDNKNYEALLPNGTTSVTLNIETEAPSAKVKVEKINSLAKSNSITKLSTQVTLTDLVDGSNLYKVTVTSVNEKVVDDFIIDIVIKYNEINISNSYQLEDKATYTYMSSNNSIASVDQNGLITALSDGSCEVLIYEENNLIKKYLVNVSLVPIQFVSGYRFNTNDSYDLNNQSYLESSLRLLTNGSYAKAGGYGSLLLASRSGAYIVFDVKQDTIISFSSNSYSDGGGSSGATGVFYKLDDNNNYQSYYQLQQLNNKKNYGDHLFTKGRYKLSISSGVYLVFDEWDFYDYQ